MNKRLLGQIFRKILIITLSVSLLFAVTSQAFASTTDEKGYIEIFAPKDDAVYYQGEKIKYDFDAYDCWVNYYSKPVVYAKYYGLDNYAFVDIGDTVETDGYDNYTGSIYTSDFDEGWYEFGVMLWAYEHSYDDWDDYTTLGNEPWATLSFKIRKLKAPSNLKITAGKNKVTISYKKATGATKYEIYRSTKKSSGYKKIATVKATKYVDKTAKKGKRYYYKVRSVRSGNGVVRSSYTSAKRSGKVK